MHKTNHNPKGKYKIEYRATRTPEKYDGRVRCLRRVSIRRKPYFMLKYE
jgi:hypothetical protein